METWEYTLIFDGITGKNQMLSVECCLSDWMVEVLLKAKACLVPSTFLFLLAAFQFCCPA